MAALYLLLFEQYEKCDIDIMKFYRLSLSLTTGYVLYENSVLKTITINIIHYILVGVYIETR